MDVWLLRMTGIEWKVKVGRQVNPSKSNSPAKSELLLTGNNLAHDAPLVASVQLCALIWRVLHATRPAAHDAWCVHTVQSHVQ